MSSDMQQVELSAGETKEFLSEQDKNMLDMVRLKRALALSNAEKAISQNEVSVLTHDNFILRLTMKYGLNEKDALTEQGEIIRYKGDGK